MNRRRQGISANSQFGRQRRYVAPERREALRSGSPPVTTAEVRWRESWLNRLAQQDQERRQRERPPQNERIGRSHLQPGIGLPTRPDNHPGTEVKNEFSDDERIAPTVSSSTSSEESSEEEQDVPARRSQLSIEVPSETTEAPVQAMSRGEPRRTAPETDPDIMAILVGDEQQATQPDLTDEQEVTSLDQFTASDLQHFVDVAETEDLQARTEYFEAVRRLRQAKMRVDEASGRLDRMKRALELRSGQR